MCSTRRFQLVELNVRNEQATEVSDSRWLAGGHRVVNRAIGKPILLLPPLILSFGPPPEHHERPNPSAVSMGADGQETQSGIFSKRRDGSIGLEWERSGAWRRS